MSTMFTSRRTTISNPKPSHGFGLRLAAAAGAAALAVGGVVAGDIALSTAPTASAATAVAESLPKLRHGDSGKSVSALQTILNAHGYSLSVDGKFGPDTLSAVKHLQGLKGLQEDGVVGPNTWGSLVGKVRPGDSGNDVKAVQMLVGAGVDGKYGSETRQKVEAFQSAAGLSVDGVVGPDTWAALIGSASGDGGGDGGDNDGGGDVSGDRAELAQKVLADDGIELYNLCDDGDAAPKAVMEATAEGGKAATSRGGSVHLNEDMLKFMVGFGGTNSYRVTSITDCGHKGAAHYEGRAIDIDLVDGEKISLPGSGRGATDKTAAACRKYGASRVITYDQDPSGHYHHVHCEW